MENNQVRDKSAKRWILACAAGLLIAAGLGVCAALGGLSVGQTVYMIRPVVTATYSDDGKPARDDEVLYGMSGVVTGKLMDGGLIPLRTEYGYNVSVPAADIADASLLPAAWKQPAGHVVFGKHAEVTDKPDLKSYPPVMVLQRGSPVWVESTEGDYTGIRLHSGNVGYVRTALLRETRQWDEFDEKTTRHHIVDDALAYLGTSYRWGGKTPEGIDCSGLASMAYLLNGLAIYRNSRAQAGYPVALLHVETPVDGHTAESLARAKPGDMIYWRGHQGVYAGDGGFVHANATSYNARVNSLIKGDPDYREDLSHANKILAWGTAYPEEPGKITVRQFFAIPTNVRNNYRFFVRMDGYAPTEAVIYPEGTGDGKPSVKVDNPAQLVGGVIEAGNDQAPEYTYAKPGTYRPVVVLRNANGWLPDGKPIESEPYAMSELIVGGDDQ